MTLRISQVVDGLRVPTAASVFMPVLPVKISAKILIGKCASQIKSGAHVFSKIKGDRYGYQNL
jgi:hypothetical protein